MGSHDNHGVPEWVCTKQTQAKVTPHFPLDFFPDNLAIASHWLCYCNVHGQQSRTSGSWNFCTPPRCDFWRAGQSTRKPPVKKKEENGCCWSFGVIFVASRNKLLFGAETLKLTIFCMYSCMYSCTQACSLTCILTLLLEWMLLCAPWWTFPALVEQLKRTTGMSGSSFESG